MSIEALGISVRPVRVFCALVVALMCALAVNLGVAAPLAHAETTAAEKRAEAAEIEKHIDSLQTGLNAARNLHANATAQHDEAVALRDDAAHQIEEESARLDTLEKKLSSFAISMYKSDGAGTFLGVLLETTSFHEFMTQWDRCSAISTTGSNMLQEAKATRARLEEAHSTYEQQAERAEQQMKAAEASMTQIANTQAALQGEVAKLNDEAARLEEEEAAKAKDGKAPDPAQVEADLAAKESEIKDRAAAAAAAAASANAEASAALLMGNGYFTNPCPGSTESSGFGYRDFDHSFHKGLDMAAPEGTPYYAADSGTVLYATNDGGYNGGAGNWVVIAHGNGIVTKYMHSLTTFVKPGDEVQRGQNIGLVGNTGNSTGPHLHFQVELDGVAVNPLNYI